MWQKCPICNGTGKIHNTSLLASFDVCSTCNGTKIISELTGLPPQYAQNKIEHQKVSILKQMSSDLPDYPSTDFRDANLETQQEYFGK